MNPLQTVITGTGSYIPTQVKGNDYFGAHEFYDEHRQAIPSPVAKIIEKFQAITGINERRYADENLLASGMGSMAALRAIEGAGIDAETIDQVIVAHNFGDICKSSIQSDAVPSLASRVKRNIGIRNPDCIAYDILFGCPGWLQGLIQADAFIRSGMAQKCLVIGTETLSRVVDVHDRDSMIFSDGAGAVLVEGLERTDAQTGFIGGKAQSYVLSELNYINMGSSYMPGTEEDIRYIKMQGRKVYEFALRHVPVAMKACIDASGVDIKEVKKIFIHQANEKMDEAIVSALYKLYDIVPDMQQVMPMNIATLGNSSVATIPTLYDMVCRGALPGHQLEKGDVIVFASVGAGMNINAVCYRY